MQAKLDDYVAEVAKLRSKHELFSEQLVRCEADISALTANQVTLKQAREVITSAMILSQTKIKDYIEEVVSLGLNTVFGEAYKFCVDYDIRRNQSEAELYMTKDGERCDFDDDLGGGVLDVAAFGLRMALWALMSPKPNNSLILDEPAKWISKDKLELFGILLNKVSELFGIQIIMVTHDETLIEYADRIFFVTQNNGVSAIEQMER